LQDDCLFPPETIIKRAIRPDFKLSIPKELTQDIYMKILSKIFACIRFRVYSEIRHIIREGGSIHINKGQLMEIMRKLDVWEIRNKVFEVYGLSELNEPSYRTLIKAHLIFLSSEGSKTFEQTIRYLRQGHQRYMTAILASDVFPGLDKTNPLDSKQETSIPDRYGSRWYEHEMADAKKHKAGVSDLEESEEANIEKLEEDIDQMKGDVWK
jgi:hypothetical protein